MPIGDFQIQIKQVEEERALQTRSAQKAWQVDSVSHRALKEIYATCQGDARRIAQQALAQRGRILRGETEQ